MMPGMDGWAVLKALKEDPDTADIPVIMLTMVDDKELGYALGVSDYMTKPIDRDHLVSQLGKYRSGPGPHPILVVEDDANSRDVMTRTLTKEGWSVATAENGKVGLQRVKENRPNLIMLDLMMPVMDGFEFVRELRKVQEWRTIPIIIVTSKDLTPDDHLQLDGYVQKILQKGAYKRGELLDEITDLVKVSVDQAKQQ